MSNGSTRQFMHKLVIIELESVLPGNRMADTVERLAKGFYPDLFQ